MAPLRISAKTHKNVYLYCRVTTKTASAEIQLSYAEKCHLDDDHIVGWGPKHKKARKPFEKWVHEIASQYDGDCIIVVYDPFVIGDSWTEIRRIVASLHEVHIPFVIASICYYDEYVPHYARSKKNELIKFDNNGRDYKIFMAFTDYLSRLPDKRKTKEAEEKTYRSSERGRTTITLDDYSDDIVKAFRAHCTDETFTKQDLIKAFAEQGVKLPSKATLLRLISDMDGILLEEHKAAGTPYTVKRSAQYRANRGLPCSTGEMDDPHPHQSK